MSRYLYLGRYTGEGIEGVVAEGGSRRETETRDLFERIGGRVESYDFAVGPECDFVIIADVPDVLAAIVPPLLASSGGKVIVRTTPLLTPQQLDAATQTARGITFRSAGD